MRIGFIVVKNVLRGGGIEKYTYEVGRRLVKRGHEVVVFSMGHYGAVAPEVEGMRIVRIPCVKLSIAEKTSASALATIRALLHRPKLDVLHFHSVAAGSFGVLPRLLGRPTVLQMHGVEWQRSRWGGFGQFVLHLMERVSLAAHSVSTAVSRTQCDFYRARNGKEMVYIPTAAEFNHGSAAVGEIARYGLVPGHFVLFAARLVKEKGAHYLIGAFHKLHTDWKLVIAGSARAEDRYLRALHDLAAGDARIVFAGHVEGELKHQLFSHAGLYVQPSEIEGLSISLLEAMGYGLECLASSIPENQEAMGGDRPYFPQQGFRRPAGPTPSAAPRSGPALEVRTSRPGTHFGLLFLGLRHRTTGDPLCHGREDQTAQNRRRPRPGPDGPA